MHISRKQTHIFDFSYVVRYVLNKHHMWWLSLKMLLYVTVTKCTENKSSRGSITSCQSRIVGRLSSRNIGSSEAVPAFSANYNSLFSG